MNYVILDRKIDENSFGYPNTIRQWAILLPEHLKNDLTSLLSKNKKYKGH